MTWPGPARTLRDFRRTNLVEKAHILRSEALGCHVLLRCPTGHPSAPSWRPWACGVNGLGHYRFMAADVAAEPNPRLPGLVLGFGNVTEHQISRGIRVLAKAVRRGR
jgi:GntR family transcriptional regulator / MocR family aminotransferase